MNKSSQSDSYIWPDGSCSAALIHQVFIELTEIKPAPRDILTALHLSESNGFAASDKVRQVDEKDSGINLDEFLAASATVFESFGAVINFRWIPFNKIPYSLYEEAIQEHSQKGTIIGCCLDYSFISQITPARRHICRCEYTKKSVVLTHYDRPGPETESVPIELWEKSVLSVNGGLFIFNA